MKLNKTISILGALLIIAVLFIAATQIRAYNLSKKQQQEAIYEQGTQDGYQYAVAQLMQQAATCNPVPLFMNNVSMNIIAVECLQQAQE